MVYKDISHVNWAAMTTAGATVADLNIEGSFLIPQLLALIASQMPPVKKGDKYSFQATLIDIVANSKAGLIKYANGKSLSTAEVQGIFTFLNATPRGEVLGGAKQIDPKVVRYATGVPLILSAYREYKDIPYSAWDYDCENIYLKNFIDKDTLSVLEYLGSDIEFTDSELLQFRVIGGTFKTGAKAGQTKHPNSITTINKVGNDLFDALPKLLRLMLCQTWVFQPSVRSKYAITSIKDLDSLAVDISGGVDLFKADTAKSSEADSLWA